MSYYFDRTFLKILKMPQELHVLRCFQCETFQVDIVKKIPKWICKMCGAKQSVKKVYGAGSGKDCRLLVQSLNEQRMTQTKFKYEEDFDNLKLLECNNGGCEVLKSYNNKITGVTEPSKWTQFTETQSKEDTKNIQILQNHSADMSCQSFENDFKLIDAKYELSVKRERNEFKLDDKCKFLQTQKYETIEHDTVLIQSCDNIFEDNNTDLDSVLKFI